MNPRAARRWSPAPGRSPRSGSSTWGSAPSTAPIRPGTPAHAADADRWGIAAYSGRSAALADALNTQGGLYTLIVRSPDDDRAEVVGSIARAHGGSEFGRFLDDVSAPTTAILSLTITEAAYSSTETDVDAPALQALAAGAEPSEIEARTALGRVVLALEARRRSGGEPLALLSCDNLPDNGGVLRAAVLSLAHGVPELEAWVESSVSFVSSSVDRITPRLPERGDGRARGSIRRPRTGRHRALLRLGDRRVLPGGEAAVGDSGRTVHRRSQPWEARKLWLLNGATAFWPRSVVSVGTAPCPRRSSRRRRVSACRRGVLGTRRARISRRSSICRLIGRRCSTGSGNPRIQHLLTQIALDADTKMRVRIARWQSGSDRRGAQVKPARASSRHGSQWMAALPTAHRSAPPSMASARSSARTTSSSTPFASLSTRGICLRFGNILAIGCHCVNLLLH